MKMSSSEIKSELKTLIDKETDLEFLKDVKAIFDHENVDPSKEQEMISRVLKSEQDIREGKVFTIEESKDRLKKSLGF